MEASSLDFSISQSGVNWPTKINVLETPERKRFRHSISFADSGLGSSMYSSPPECVLMKTAKTSPLLRTPTDRLGQSVYSLRSATTPSPLRSFVHMSSYSSAFSSPELRQCPVSRQELRLSNPENATGYQFTGNSLCKNNSSPINVADGDLITHSRPLSVKQYHFTTPSTSRASNRFLVLPPSSGDIGTENGGMAADATLPYVFPETPSKPFLLESMERNVFGVDDFSDIVTCESLRDVGEGHLEVAPMRRSTDQIFEQASGPLECSVCEPFQAPPADGSASGSPKKILFSTSTPLERPRINRVFNKNLVKDEIFDACEFSAVRPSAEEVYGTDKDSSSETPICDSKPFKAPIKPLKPFSRLWSQITFGETKHQREMTRNARSFLDTHSTSAIT